MAERSDDRRPSVTRLEKEIVLAVVATFVATYVWENFRDHYGFSSLVLDVAVGALWRLAVIFGAFRLQQWLARWPKARRIALWTLLGAASGVFLLYAFDVPLLRGISLPFRIMNGIAVLSLQMMAGYKLRPPKPVRRGIEFEILKPKNMTAASRERIWPDPDDASARLEQDAFDAIFTALAEASTIFRDTYNAGRFSLPSELRASTKYNLRNTIGLDAHIDELIRKHLRTPSLSHVDWESDIRTIGNLKSGHSWVVDPIDGSRHLARDLPLYGCTIALTQDGHPALSAIYIPTTEELFFAVRGRGAFLNSWNSRLHVSDTGTEEALVYVEFPNRDLAQNNQREFDSECVALTQLFRTVKRVRGFGLASLGLAYVAKGTFDAYVTLPGTTLKSDIAAGELLVMEAGGQVRVTEARVGTLSGVRVLAANAKLFETLGGMFADTHDA